MKIEIKWRVIQKGNGKFYTQYSNGYTGFYWPWENNEFETLEEAKLALVKQKEKLDRITKENQETVVFELI